MATRNGLEPSTSSVTGERSNQLNYRATTGGNNRARTCDPLLVRQMLSQLSYAPTWLPFFVTRIIIHHLHQKVNTFLKLFLKKFFAEIGEGWNLGRKI